MSLQTLVNDPQFSSLSPDDQKKAVVSLEPQAQNLNPQEYGTFLKTLNPNLETPSIQPNWIDQLKSGFNQPTIPLKKWGGEALDMIAQKTGMGQDRSVFKQDFPATYGTLKATAGKAEQLTSPMNVGIGLGMAAASPEVAGVAAGTFAVQGLMNLFKTAPQKLQEYKAAVASGDNEKQAEILTDAGLDVGMTGVAAKAFAGGLSLPTSITGEPNYSKLSGNPTDITKQQIQSFPNKFATPSTPEQQGSVIQQEFNKSYSPQEAQVQAQKAQAEQVPGKVADFQTKRIGTGEPVSPIEAGQTYAQDIQNTLAQKYATSKGLYQKLGDQMGDVKATNDSAAKDFIETVFGQRGVSGGNLDSNVGNNTTDALLQKQLQRQYGMTPQDSMAVMDQLDAVRAGKLTSASIGERTLNAYKFMDNILGKLANPNLTAKDLSLMRTDASQYAHSGIETPIKKVYKGLVGALTEDINTTADENGYSTISQGARNHYRELKNFEDSDIVQATQSKDPSQLLQWASKTPERVGRLMDSLSPEAKKSVQSGYLTKINESATDKSTGQVDPGKVTSEINKVPDETLKTVFGEKFPIIDAYRKYSNTLDNSDLFSEPQNAKLAKNVQGQEPSFLVQSILRDGSIEALRNLKDNLGTDGMDTLKRGVWDQVIRNSQDDSGKLDLGKFAGVITGIEKTKPGWLETLYGKDDYNAISATRQIADFADKKLGGDIATPLAQMALWRSVGMKVLSAKRAISNIIPRIQAPGIIGGIIQQTGATQLAPQYFNPKTVGSGSYMNNLANQGLVRPPLKDEDQRKGLAQGLR